MMRRVTSLTWCIICLAVAAHASTQMLITFAPRAVVSDSASECKAEAQRAELSGIERARKLWAIPVFLSSGLLAVNSVALVILARRRR